MGEAVEHKPILFVTWLLRRNVVMLMKAVRETTEFKRQSNYQDKGGEYCEI
jgi:hypothetical protein